MQSWLKAGLMLSSWDRRFCHSASELRPRLRAIARCKRSLRGAASHRGRGFISAVICDGMPSEAVGGARRNTFLVYVPEDEVSSCYKKMGHQVFMSTVFIMHISSYLKPQTETFEEPVLPRTVNFDGCGRITNVRFIRAPLGVKLKLNCPIVLTGAKDCVGIHKGGLLKEYYSFLHLSCPPEMLPALVEVDIRKLDIGDQILVRDVKLKVDLHPDLDPASPICEITSRV